MKRFISEREKLRIANGSCTAQRYETTTIHIRKSIIIFEYTI